MKAGYSDASTGLYTLLVPATTDLAADQFRQHRDGLLAGDPNTLKRMVGLAAKHNVDEGAHTGVRNTVGFSINGFRYDLVRRST
jgi:hypothetical protein